jgi:hypothetical protein
MLCMQTVGLRARLSACTGYTSADNTPLPIPAALHAVQFYCFPGSERRTPSIELEWDTLHLLLSCLELTKM